MKRGLTIASVVWIEMLRRKDVYVLFILLLAFLMILMSLNVFGLGGLVVYVKEIGLLLTWLFSWILAVNISSRLLPQEETQRTIFPLLAKPISRAEIVFGKWLGAWVVSSVATLVFYAALVVIVGLRGSWFCWTALAQGIALHLCLLGIFSAIGIAFSTRMNSDAAASLTYVLTLSSFLILPRVPELVMHVKGLRQTGLLILYYALPHFELFDMRLRLVHQYPPAQWKAILLVLAYGCIMIIIFLALSWMAYRNKRFSQGVLQ